MEVTVTCAVPGKTAKATLCKAAETGVTVPSQHSNLPLQCTREWPGTDHRCLTASGGGATDSMKLRLSQCSETSTTTSSYSSPSPCCWAHCGRDGLQGTSASPSPARHSPHRVLFYGLLCERTAGQQARKHLFVRLQHRRGLLSSLQMERRAGFIVF